MAVLCRANLLAMTLGLGLAGCGAPPATETTAHTSAEPSAPAAKPTNIQAPEPFIVPSPLPKLPDPGQKGGMSKPEEVTAPNSEVKPATPDPAPSTAPVSSEAKPK